MRIQCTLCSLYQLGVIGKAQVVVGTEIQNLLPAFQFNFRLLGGGDNAFILEETGFADLFQFPEQMLFDFSVHS